MESTIKSFIGLNLPFISDTISVNVCLKKEHIQTNMQA